MRCILHIGPSKTGTSSIQNFLRRNRKLMLERGIFVPPTKRPRQDEVLLAIRRDYSPTKILSRWGIYSQSDMDRVREEMAAEVKGWLATEDWNTIVLSHEGFSSRLPEELEDLKSLLGERFDEIRVVAVLRRQDLKLNSTFKNAVRNKGYQANAFTWSGLNYEQMLENFAKVFGEKNVRPYIFPDSTDESFDLVEEFLRVAELPTDGWNFPKKKVANEAWDSRAIDLLRHINPLLPPLQDGKMEVQRQIVERAVMNAFPLREYGFHIGKERAEAVLQDVADSNRKVAQRWFGRDELFSNDMSKYDQEVRLAEPEDFAKVIVELAKLQELKLK